MKNMKTKLMTLCVLAGFALTTACNSNSNDRTDEDVDTTMYMDSDTMNLEGNMTDTVDNMNNSLEDRSLRGADSTVNPRP